MRAIVAHAEWYSSLKSSTSRSATPSAHPATRPFGRRKHFGLEGKDLLGEHEIHFGVRVRAGIAQHGELVITIGCFSHGGKRYATGRNAGEHEVCDPPRAQEDLKVAAGEGSHASSQPLGPRPGARGPGGSGWLRRPHAGLGGECGEDAVPEAHLGMAGTEAIRTKIAGTARSATSPRTSSKRRTQTPVGRPLCLK